MTQRGIFSEVVDNMLTTHIFSVAHLFSLSPTLPDTKSNYPIQNISLSLNALAREAEFLHSYLL